MTGSQRRLSGLVAIALAALVICVLRLLMDRDVDGAVSLAWPPAEYAWVRWTALAVGATVGAALSISGVLLQALLRNPLASPFILGISAGAGLGVMIATYLGHLWDASWMAYGSDLGPALLGALGALALVYGLSQRRGWVDPMTLLLVGVIVSSMCGAMILLLQHLVPMGLKGDLVRWMMGRIPEHASGVTLALSGALTVVGLGVAMRMGRAMDAATLGDDEARSIGLAIGPLRQWMFILAGALAAASVALCGPIGFVGLVAPHAARLLLGPRHTPLVLGAALVGVCLVVGADAGRQALDLGAGRMPIGIFTALIGGPAFIWLLVTGRGQS